MNKNIFEYELKINSAGKTFCTPDWNWDTGKQNWQDFDLWTVIGGEGKLRVYEGGSIQKYDLMSGDCFLLQGNERYVGTHNTDDPLVVIHIHFDFFDNGIIVRPERNEILTLYRRLENLSFCEEILNRVLSLHSVNPGEATKWLQAVLLEIMRQDRMDKYSGVELEQKSLIEEICSRIKRNPGQYHNLEEIKNDLPYSKDHFIRLFKKYKGTTPYKFLLNTRLEVAKTLLMTSSHNIGRISDILGYKEVYHFSKQFRNRTGVSPSEFRKKG